MAAQFAHRRVGRAVEVSDLVCGVAWCLAGESQADQGLGAHPLAKLDKFLEPGVARLEPAPHSGERNSPGGVADRVLPVEPLGRRSAEADDAGLHRLECQGHVAPPAEDVVIRHERHLVDPERARPAERNREGGILVRLRGSEDGLESLPSIIGLKLGGGVGFSLAPERYLDRPGQAG